MKVFIFIVAILFTTVAYSQNPLIFQDTTTVLPDTSINIPIDLSTISDSTIIEIDSSGTDSISIGILDISENAVDEPINYKANDSILFDVSGQKVYLYGQAQIIYGSIELNADYIELNLDSNLVFAIGVPDSTNKIAGSPHFKDGGDEFDAKELRYNFETKKGLIKNVITEQSGGFLHSDRTKMHPNKDIHLKGGKYTTCDLEHPHFYIALTKAVVIPDDKIVSGPAYLVIEDVPLPLGIPFGFFPDQKSHKSGIIIPEYGQEQNRGFFLRNGGYYYYINDYVDLQLRGDIYSKGTWGFQTDSRYNIKYKFNGSFSAKYSSLKIIEDEKPQNTYWLKWTHNQDQKARPNSRFSANVDLGSSSYNFYNSNNINRRLQNEVSSSISYSKSFANSPFSLSANFRHTQNNQDSTVSLSLPDLNFNVSRINPFKKKQRVGKSRWYEQINFSSATSFRNTIKIHEDTLFREEALSRFKNGIMHKVPVSTSVKLLKVLNLNPSFAYTERWYLMSIRKNFLGYDSLNRYQYRVDTIQGFSRGGDYLITIPLTTKFYGFFINKNSDSYFQALRHVVTPSISYSYRPDYGKGQFGYYKQVIDPLTNDTLETYSIFEGGNNSWSGIYGSPPSGKYGSINFRLGNNLEMKVKTKKDTTDKKIQPIKILDNLSFGSSYNMAADSLKWSMFNIQARTRIKMFDLNFSANFDPYYWDTLGRQVDQFLYDIESSENRLGGQMGRLKNASMSIGFYLNSNNSTKEKEQTDAKIEAAREAGLPGNYWEDYVDFDIPWTIRVDYNYTYNQYLYHNDTKRFEYKTMQTVNFSGDFNLTEKWKISYSSGWDFENKALTSNTSINIHRDLHCWEASFHWIPMGTFRSYNFQINVKSSVLQSLKLNRQRSWTDNF
ncbi:MAG: putative LPS assembly protein LptD [Bacteroidota bacterium]